LQLIEQKILEAETNYITFPPAALLTAKQKRVENSGFPSILNWAKVCLSRNANEQKPCLFRVRPVVDDLTSH